MMHGHVRIDLHNVRTGSNERIEHDNLVTNAVKEILPYQFGSYPNYLYSGNNDYLNSRHTFPIATQLLGGIMLFDGKLTEDAAHFYFPSEAHLIGFAGRSLDSSHSFMGSFNSLESGSNDRGYTSVWDFNTSQCNGDIAALALAHNWISNGVFTSAELHGYNRLGDAYDDKTQLQYYMNNAEIRQRRLPTTRFKLNDTLWNTNSDKLIEDKQNFNDVFKEYYATIGQHKWAPYYNGYYYDNTQFRDIAGWYWGYDGFLYLMYHEMTRQGKTIYVQKFVSSDHTFTVSGDPITITFESNMYLRTDKCCISNGYLYIISYDNAREVIRVNLSNTVDQHTYTLDKPAELINALPYGGAKVYYSGNYDANKASDILYPDGETRNFADKGFGAYSMWGCGGWLGTICNLGTAIEKTSAQTMKITYTLTDVEETEETTTTDTTSSDSTTASEETAT